MGLLDRHSNRNANGAATHGTHHPVRDGLLAGGLAHHESKGGEHVGRNTALAGGAIGAFEHHRNEKELGTNGIGHNHHHTANTAPLSTGATGAAGGTTINGGTHGMNTGISGTGANTGAAPIAGATAMGSSAGAGVGGGKFQSVVSGKQANRLERKGKLESTLADLTCSSSLRNKSQNHLAQADHLRMQSSELGEAERLENEAGMRRQRAVGLGADPTHASGTTGFGPNGTGAAGTGMGGVGGNRTAAVM